MTRRLTPAQGKALVHAPGELAFLDVREHGQYGEGHPLFVVNCPYSRLELLAPRLVPNVRVPVLLIDDGDRIAERGAERLKALGYEDLAIVEGGAPAWGAAGFTLHKGVNVPSKVMGELIEARSHPETVDAGTLAAWRAEGRDHILFDTRPPAEYRKMTVPGARSLPNGELLHRFAAAVPDGDTPVVLTCAGRTRGLVGAIGLRAGGIRNPVYALENGTQGWALAGLALDRGAVPDPLPGMDRRTAEESRRRGESLSARAGIPFIDAARFGDLAGDGARTLYLLDVRSGEEYAAGHLPGAVHAPGVQIVQATDHWVGVRRTRLVLTDDTGLRAALAAFWLKQLGHEVFVLREADAAGLDDRWVSGRPLPREPEPARVPGILPQPAAHAMREGRAKLLDLRSSMDHRNSHPVGAEWAIRPRLQEAAANGQPLLLLADEPTVAGLAAVDLRELGASEVRIVAGAFAAWQAAGLPVETTPDQPSDEDAIDFLFFVHDRHDGNLDAARRYLAWETGLVQHLDEAERAEFRLIDP
jgi:rhodanese-related sulfurtransferase